MKTIASIIVTTIAAAMFAGCGVAVVDTHVVPTSPPDVFCHNVVGAPCSLEGCAGTCVATAPTQVERAVCITDKVCQALAGTPCDDATPCAQPSDPAAACIEYVCMTTTNGPKGNVVTTPGYCAAAPKTAGDHCTGGVCDGDGACTK